MALASPRYAFKEAVVAGAPDDPGLYAIYFGEHLLYVGVAPGSGGDSIRARLLLHVEGELKPSVATHCTWEITSQPEKRLAELLELLRPKLPPYNAPGA